MSDVEETLERIKTKPGVIGYVICNAEGTVLRRFPTMTPEQAESYLVAMRRLAAKAGGVVRDMNPRDNLEYLRIRCKKQEVVVARDEEFLVIVIQRWTPAEQA
mmetsp:Transcript_3001/g.12135  ORF Transcript_3001/g.12135 Transcript_3001/m.12135 type:complete len:103 (-) Transcript_3001:87-395(-)